MIRLTDIRYAPGSFQNPGDVVQLSEAEEAELVASGRAVRIETATAKPQQTAHKPTNKGRKR
jgi:hypothetical protein